MKMNSMKRSSKVWSPGFSRQGFHFAERAGTFLARFELRTLCRLKAGLHTCGWTLTFALLLLLFTSGCQTDSARTISNSGYVAPDQYAPPPWQDAHRELSEFDVLGLEPGQGISEEEITRASDHPQHVSLKPGSSVLLVQSGAMYPDGPMVEALSGHFNVVPFTGVATETKNEPPPPLNRWPYYRTGNVALLAEPGRPAAFVPLLRERERENESTPSPKPGQPAKESYSRLLRLAAARGGADTILCYWGILESENERLATKTVSWMPFMGWVVPDEREHLRIRVKMAVIDVRTGAWTMLSPEPFEDKALSASARRAAVDQKHVESLKVRAYAAAAKDLIEKYAKS